MPSLPKETYLGDGVYAYFDGFTIWLWASNGITKSQPVALEPETLDHLNEYATRVKANRK